MLDTGFSFLEHEFLQADLQNPKRLIEKGKTREFQTAANTATQEVLELITKEIPLTQDTTTQLVAGPAGKLPTPEQRVVAQTSLAGSSHQPIRFRPEEVPSSKLVRKVPPVTIMMLFENEAKFAASPELLSQALAMIDFGISLDSPEGIRRIAPGIVTPRTSMKVLLAEQKTLGVKIDARTLEMGINSYTGSGRQLINHFIEAAHTPVDKLEAPGLLDTGREDAILGFGSAVQNESNAGNLPLVIAGFDKWIDRERYNEKSTHILQPVPRPLVYMPLQNGSLPFALKW